MEYGHVARQIEKEEKMYSEGTIQAIVSVLGVEVEDEIRTVLGVKKRPSNFDEGLFLLRKTSFGSEEEEERLSEALRLALTTKECLSLLEGSSGSMRRQILERALELVKTLDDYFLVLENVPSFMEDSEWFSEKVAELIVEFESVKECLDFHDKISNDQHKEKAINAAFELVDDVDEYMEIYGHPTVRDEDKRKALECAVDLIHQGVDYQPAAAVDECLDLSDRLNDSDKVWMLEEVFRRNKTVQGYLNIFAHRAVREEDKKQAFNLALDTARTLEECKKIFWEMETNSPEARACILKMAETVESQSAKVVVP